MRAHKLQQCKRVYGLHFTPDGLTCAAGMNGKVVVWDVDA